MKILLRTAVALGAILAAPLAFANEDGAAGHRHRGYHPAHHRAHVVEPARPAVNPAPAPEAPSFKPYEHSGEHGNDGLSRDPEDCNKGCIGGNPG